MVYGVQLAVSLSFCVKRRVAVRSKLQRISRAYRTIGRDDLPDVRLRPAPSDRAAYFLFLLQSVHKYVTQEYTRACLIAYESLPADVRHPGWGRPGASAPFVANLSATR